MQTTDAGHDGQGADAPASPTRPRLVGIFGLVGLLLIVGALALLSSSRAFGQRRTFVAFFPNPVGLKAGSPVTFRQTPVGEVRTVELVFTGREFESETMVVFDLARGSLRSLKGELSMRKLDDRAFAATLAKAGLRGSVRSSSPIGGSKSLDFDFRPEVAARLTGIETRYPELPTGSVSRLDVLQGKVEKALEKISDLPLEETIAQVRATLESAQKLLDSGDLNGALANLRRVLATTDRAVARTEKTLDNVDGLMGDVRATLSKAQETMKTTDGALTRLDTTLATVDRNVERTADTQYQTIRSIDELNELLRTLRQLVDTMQQHPESLLQGKPEPKEKQ
jgi:phospholipid/cholesterol/gamma-HCH transport system substrate-binding protein